MPTPYPVTPNVQAIEFDGSNAAEINDAVEQLTIINQQPGILTFQSPSGGETYTANTGDTIVYTQGAVTAVLDPDDLEYFYNCAVTCESVPEAKPAIRAMGVSAVPTLAMGANATVSVTLQPAMEDTEFEAYASKFAGASVADLTVSGVTVVDASTVEVAVTNNGSVTLAGANVAVHAVA